jgi:hypothetical protein
MNNGYIDLLESRDYYSCRFVVSIGTYTLRHIRMESLRLIDQRKKDHNYSYKAKKTQTQKIGS